jgi:Ca2+:H+ antiporter
MSSVTKSDVIAVIRGESFLAVSLVTSLLFFLFDDVLLGGLGHPLWMGVAFLWLFAVVLWSALSVVRHADCLALRLGEPYGTLILTLSAISIEVMMISAMMLHGENNPTLARDTMFAVVMILLNGMVGLSLLLGGLRHREQQYNLQGANAYLSVIIPLAVLGLILPNFTISTEGPTLSGAQEAFLILMSLGLYGAFLAIQTSRHKTFFVLKDEGDGEHPESLPARSTPFHGVMLIAYLLPVVYLAEKLALPIDYGIEMLHAPMALGGVIVAILVATPESIGAVRAAMANRLQRSVNILLGSVLSTIGLTIPAVLAISLATGKPVVLGLQNADFVMLLLSLAVSVVTFASGRTNVLQGTVHLLLFLAYLMFIFAR